MRFDFQGQGTFLLLGVQMRDLTGPPLSTTFPGLHSLDFALFARLRPAKRASFSKPPSMVVSWAAVAKGGQVLLRINSGGTRGLPQGDGCPALVPQKLPSDAVVIGTGTAVSWPSLQGLSITDIDDISVSLPPALWGGNYGRARTWGLLGTFDGDKSNEFVKPDGTTYDVSAGGEGSWGVSGMQSVIDEWGESWRAANLPGAASNAALAVLGPDLCISPSSTASPSVTPLQPTVTASATPDCYPNCNPSLDAFARSTCGIGATDPLPPLTEPAGACHYDVSVSGDPNIALASLHVLTRMEEASEQLEVAPYFVYPAPASSLEPPVFTVFPGQDVAIPLQAAVPQWAVDSGALTSDVTVKYGLQAPEAGGLVDAALTSGDSSLEVDADSGLLVWRNVSLQPKPSQADVTQPGGYVPVYLSVSAQTLDSGGQPVGAPTLLSITVRVVLYPSATPTPSRSPNRSPSRSPVGRGNRSRTRTAGPPHPTQPAQGHKATPSSSKRRIRWDGRNGGPNGNAYGWSGGHNPHMGFADLSRDGGNSAIPGYREQD